MKERNMTISASKANWYGTGFFIVLYIAARLGFKLIWGEEDPAKEISEGYFILVLVAGFVVHELIHGLGWMLASGCGWKNISFGFMWSALMPYCHCDVPMRMKLFSYSLRCLPDDWRNWRYHVDLLAPTRAG